SEFWWFALFCLLLNIAVGIVSTVSETLSGILGFVVWLAVIVPSIAVSVRRLHDIDRTGWWVLINLIPLIGLIILLFFFVQRGTPGDNRFGPDPLGDVTRRFA